MLGKSPLSYFQDLRVERALHLIRTTHIDIEAIAAEVSYADGVTLRTLLRRRLGRGVRELRRDESALQAACLAPRAYHDGAWSMRCRKSSRSRFDNAIVAVLSSG